MRSKIEKVCHKIKFLREKRKRSCGQFFEKIKLKKQVTGSNNKIAKVGHMAKLSKKLQKVGPEVKNRKNRS